MPSAWRLWCGVTLESALLFGMYAMWQFAGSFTVMGKSGALARAHWLWDAERWLRLPSEMALQRLRPVLKGLCASGEDVGNDTGSEWNEILRQAGQNQHKHAERDRAKITLQIRKEAG